MFRLGNVGTMAINRALALLLNQMRTIIIHIDLVERVERIDVFNKNEPEDIRCVQRVPDTTARVRRIDARELLAGERELRILHDGREYRLQLTSKGRLILTA